MADTPAGDSTVLAPWCVCGHAKAVHRRPYRLRAWWWNHVALMLDGLRPCRGRYESKRQSACSCPGYREMWRVVNPITVTKNGSTRRPS